MSNRDVNSGFSDVDRAADPAHFVRQMDAMRSTPITAAYFARKYEVLQVRPGMHVLDLGCGPGADVRALAERVGPTGHVIGVDRSEVMVREAQARCADSGLPIEFRVGDAHHLDFPDGVFDLCHAERVFHHLEDPPRAFGELVRVAKPGARVVVVEPDFETAVVDSSDRALTRTLLHLACDVLRNGWMGRHLYALFRGAGLLDVAVEPRALTFTDFATADQFLWLERTAQRAVEDRLASTGAVAGWLEALREADRVGQFFAAVEGFLATGHKPVP